MLLDNDTNEENEDLQMQVSDDFDFENIEENVEPRMQILETGLQEEINVIKFHENRSFQAHVNVGGLLKESFDILNAENLDPEI